MKISPRPFTRRWQVRSSQAEFFAQCTDELVDACGQAGIRPYNAEAGHTTVLIEIAEYWRWMEAAIACGFVMSDVAPDFERMESAIARPREIEHMSFIELRRFVHSLQRSDKNGHHGPSAVARAVSSGSLGDVAKRLQSDLSLYEPEESELDEDEDEAGD